MKAREIIREAVLPSSSYSTSAGRTRRASTNSASNNQTMRTENPPPSGNPAPSASSDSVPAAVPEFTPKAKPFFGLKRETPDVNAPEAAASQDEKKASTRPRSRFGSIGFGKGLSSGPYSRRRYSGQGTDIDKAAIKETEVMENSDDDEKMQGGLQPLGKESTDVDNR